MIFLTVYFSWRAFIGSLRLGRRKLYRTDPGGRNQKAKSQNQNFFPFQLIIFPFSLISPNFSNDE
jgi:hypothetical protein